MNRVLRLIESYESFTVLSEVMLSDFFFFYQRVGGVSDMNKEHVGRGAGGYGAPLELYIHTLESSMSHFEGQCSTNKNMIENASMCPEQAP